MVTFSIKETGKKKIMTIEGELVITHAKEFKDSLSGLLKGGKTVALNLANVTTIDLSCIQLICSVLTTVKNSKKNLFLMDDCPENIRQSFNSIGFLYKGMKNKNA